MDSQSTNLVSNPDQESKQTKQTASSKVLSVETFDPLNIKARIDSPRSVQAAFNLSINIEELYTKTDDQVLSFIEAQGLTVSSEYQTHVIRENMEKLRKKAVDEVIAERNRLIADNQSPNSKKEDFFGMTSTSFFLSPERQSQKLEQVRRQQERELYVLVQEELRVQNLQDELQKKYTVMEQQQLQLQQQREQKRQMNEYYRQQKEDQVRKQLNDIQENKNQQWAQKQEKEKQKQDRENKKFFIRSQLQKSLSDDKNFKLKQAQESIKMAQMREQEKIDKIVQQSLQKEREKNELIEYKHNQNMQKMRNQSLEYDRKLMDIRQRIKDMEEKLVVKNEEKQIKVEQKLQELEIEKQQKSEFLKERSQQQQQQIQKAQERKILLESQRQLQILESLQKSDQHQKEFEQYQRHLIQQRQTQSQSMLERFSQVKKAFQDKKFEESLQQKFTKQCILMEQANFNVSKQRQEFAEYLIKIDQQKHQSARSKLEMLQARKEQQMSQQYNRTFQSIQNASLNAQRLKQESVENLLVQDLVRQLNHESNYRRIKSRDQSRREHLSEVLSTKSKRLNTLDSEKQRNQQAFIQQVCRIQTEHQELRFLFERAKKTGRFEEVHKFIAIHNIQLGQPLNEALSRTIKVTSPQPPPAPTQGDTIEHGDHTHPRNETTEQILINGVAEHTD